MSNKILSTLNIGNNSYEIDDAFARQKIEEINNTTTEMKDRINTLWDDCQTVTESVTEATEVAVQAKKNADHIYNDILKFLPTDTASGTVALFTDGADDLPLKSLVVGIEPVQSGEGDSSPTNVRPISGWTGMTVNANGTEITITWESEAGTVYGGSLDVLTGVLTVDRKYEVYDGSSDEIWYTYASTGFRIPKNDINEQSDGICNIAPTVTSGSSYGVSFSAANRYIYFFNSASLWGVATIKELRTWLATHNIEVCYRCTEPQTYQLTPTEVKTLLGQNNIYANCGNVSVEYRANTTAYINRKIAEAINKEKI